MVITRDNKGDSNKKLKMIDDFSMISLKENKKSVVETFLINMIFQT